MWWLWHRSNPFGEGKRNHVYITKVNIRTLENFCILLGHSIGILILSYETVSGRFQTPDLSIILDNKNQESNQITLCTSYKYEGLYLSKQV